MDYSPSGSSVHGIFQARVLTWVAISISRRFPWLGDGPQGWNPLALADGFLITKPPGKPCQQVFTLTSIIINESVKWSLEDSTCPGEYIEADPIFQVRLQQHRGSSSAELKLRAGNTGEALTFDVFQNGSVPVLVLWFHARLVWGQLCTWSAFPQQWSSVSTCSVSTGVLPATPHPPLWEPFPKTL